VTFSELVQEVAMRADEPKTVVRKVLGEALGVVEQVVMDGERVSLRSFGTFVPFEPSKRELFGGSQKSEGKRRIRFTQSRRR
jgi:nucleoid DNA-binding protein